MSWIKRFFSVFWAELSPALVAYGFCLGLFWGFLPLGPAEFATYLLLALVVFTRQSLGVMLLSGAATKVAMLMGLWRPVARTGRGALEMESLEGFWTWLLDIPVLRLLKLERYVAMGGLLWAIALSAMLFVPAWLLSRWMMGSLLPKMRGWPVIGGLARSPIGWGLRMAFFGRQPPEELASAKAASAKAASAKAASTKAEEDASEDTSTGEDKAEAAAKPRKTPGLVYWRLVIPVVVLLLITEFALGASVAEWVTRRAAEESFGVSLGFKDTQLSLVRGRLGYQEIKAEKAQESEPVATLEAAEVNVNMGHLLKGALTVEEASVTNPTLRLAREVAETDEEGKPLDEQVKEEIRKRLEDEDFVRDALKTVKETIEDWQKRAEQPPEPTTPDGSPMDPSMSAEDRELLSKATYMRERPLAWIQKLICRGLTVAIDDKIHDAGSLSLVEGALEAANITTHPGLVDDPFTLSFQGKLGGYPQSLVSIKVGHGFSKQATLIKLELTNLPMDRIDPLIRRSFDLKFNEGSKGTFSADFEIGPKTLAARPKMSFSDLNVAPRDPGSGGKVAGLDAARLAKELNTIGELTLSDVRVTGSLDDPQVVWGDSLQQLVVQGATAYARNRATQELDKGREKLEEKVNEKMEGKVGEKLNELDEKLGKMGINPSGILGGDSEGETRGESGSKDGATGAAKKVLDGAEKAAGGLLEGVLGGSSKKGEGASGEKKDEKTKGGLGGWLGKD